MCVDSEHGKKSVALKSGAARGTFVLGLAGYCEDSGCFSEWDKMPLEKFIMENDMIRYIFQISLWLLCVKRHYRARVGRPTKRLLQKLRW